MKKKLLSLFLATLMVFSCFGFETFAAGSSKNKISKIEIIVNGNIDIDTRIGSDENITVQKNGGHYSIEQYEFTNEGLKWEPTSVPELVIYLEAEENYYFALTKASQVKLKGCKYKQASITDGKGDKRNLKLIVTLPPLSDQLYPIDRATLKQDGSCSWTEPQGGGVNYEVKFMRGRALLGSKSQMFDGLSASCREYMVKGGEYYFRVRPVSKSNPDIVGEWTESDHITLSDSEANAIRQEMIDAQSRGEWIKDAKGWFFKLADGSSPAQTWRYINNEWYYFGADGYMLTGWQQIGEHWYYLDPESGKMWKNTTTPDGYELGIDGAMAKKK